MLEQPSSTSLLQTDLGELVLLAELFRLIYPKDLWKIVEENAGILGMNGGLHPLKIS